MNRPSWLTASKRLAAIVAALLLSAGSAAAQYNAQILAPPSGFATNTVRAYALGGAGHVFGVVFATTLDRRPVLWTDGIGAELPVPAGYYWEDTNTDFVNDSGTVLSRLRVPNGNPPFSQDESRVVLWQNGVPQVLQPPAADSCVSGGHRFMLPLGFNNQGHVLFTMSGDQCNNLWLWDGSDYHFIVNMYATYGFTLVHTHLNDADHVAIDHVGTNPTCTGGSATTGILTGAQYTPIAFGTATGINNHDQVLLFCLTGPQNASNTKFWDGTTLIDLGLGGFADLNDHDEVVFFSGAPATPKIYRNGSVQDLVLPDVPNFTVSNGSLLNNAGQIVLGVIAGAVERPVLYTPRTPVITWPAPQDIVYGTALGSTELNATANVPGTFSYTPAAGAVLHAGNNQALSLTFTPNDLSHYDPTTASVTINVQRAQLAVSANSAGKVFGAPVPAFSAGYAGFVNGDGPGQLSGTLTLTTTAIATSPVGTYPITPAGLSSSDYIISFLPGTLTISPAATTTTAFALPSPVGYLQPVLLAALVNPVAPGAGVPDGVVQFKDGGTVIGSATATGGIAFIIANGLASGGHSITAVYSGSGNFTGGSSAPASLTVQPLANSTFTVLVPLDEPQAVGQPARFAALVLPLAGGAPGGTVQFTDGGAALGTAPVGGSGVALFTTSALGAGLHTIGARYTGGGSFAASSAMPQLQTIYSGARPAATTTALTASPNPSTLGQLVTFTAAVTGGATTGDVNFYADTVLIGHAPIVNVSGAFQAALPVATLPAGTHIVTASYVGSAGFAASNTLPAVQVVQTSSPSKN